ncbi:MAG: hypothetical protein IKW58_00010 [Alphaproteobacteria bacterium]|nr:hypothetical protein [Alphaproteobacteria bacterium]
MEINNFKTFEEFKLYLKTHREKMPYWTEEEISNFNQKVYDLKEKSAEFKKKYDKWVKGLELKKNKEKVSIKISGTKQDEMYAKGYLKLKKIQQEKALRMHQLKYKSK